MIKGISEISQNSIYEYDPHTSINIQREDTTDCGNETRYTYTHDNVT